MKLITFMQETGPTCGLALSDSIGVDLVAADPTLPGNWHALLQDLSRVHQIHNELAARVRDLEISRLEGQPLPIPFLNLREMDLLTPIVLPSKIIAVGLNYHDHAQEQNKETPQRPMLFSKASTCLQMPGGPIELLPECQMMDAEAELVVIIGKPGRAIKKENAHEHIAGYTCFNDISDRQAQRADKQYFRAKSMDTCGPCGPWIVTPDELPKFGAGLKITCHWNDALMQSSNTDQLIFPVDELVSYISRTMTLMPGDIISTGTPGGVGVFRNPAVFLKPGDVITVEIEGIGKLVNPVVQWEESIS